MGNSERRRNTRVTFNTLADVKFPDNTYTDCETRDLSMNGVFVVGPQRKKIGEKCEIALHLSGGRADISVVIRGEVSRISDKGLALHFYEIDLENFQHLKNIVYYNSENPDEVFNEWPDHTFQDQ